MDTSLDIRPTLTKFRICLKSISIMGIYIEDEPSRKIYISITHAILLSELSLGHSNSNFVCRRRELVTISSKEHIEK